jgi:hypothetical protein
MERTGKICQIEVTENGLFIEVNPLTIYQSTHTYILLCVDIPEVIPWITLSPQTSVTLLVT